MKANPFHIIRPTEEAPPHLREDVLGSVRTAILLMRFAQLFVADYAQAILDKLGMVKRADDAGRANDPPNTE
ncbi:MAG: hypothetical protein H6591_11595 [Flavobacteriales bacterium]|nr:hypothetical protein [Flavobacteriales bacterium]